ncbi:MAG: thiosulfate dehydrogenase (quinone) large subunit, partial [Thermoleophilaceae bacterium]|nr:thiosulfate dehydrogenase (quinone) large subunit [Thermoleophilaceae bacterium]
MRLPAARPLAPGAALLPLRLFLGVTFVYAGIQKLSDPGFLHPGSPTYIGTQLHGFANGTPGGFLLRAFALPQPQLAGVGVAVLEIAIGLLATVGLLTRPAAAAGLGLNLVLFLTNSWHSYPYFLGSDIVFVFAWLPFVLTGATGQPALDTGLVAGARSARARTALALPGEGALTRRDVMSRGVGLVGVATLGIAGLAALLMGGYQGKRNMASLGGGAPAPAGSGRSGARHTVKRTRKPSVPQGAVRLGDSNRLPQGQGATYRDPADGSTDIVIRGTDGKLRAFSAV